VPKNAPAMVVDFNVYQVVVANSLTIHTLKPATRWYIDVITIGAKELHSIEAWHVRAPTRHHVASNAIYAWTSSKNAAFVLLSLK
jgi:hypothetical protein